jgi:hypothetical protein
VDVAALDHASLAGLLIPSSTKRYVSNRILGVLRLKFPLSGAFHQVALVRSTVTLCCDALPERR